MNFSIVIIHSFDYYRWSRDLVLEPTTTILGGSEIHINVGSTINLTCLVRHSPDPPAHVFWTHNQQVSPIHYSFIFLILI